MLKHLFQSEDKIREDILAADGNRKLDMEILKVSQEERRRFLSKRYEFLTDKIRELGCTPGVIQAPIYGLGYAQSLESEVAMIVLQLSQYTD